MIVNETSINKKGLLTTVICCVLWGILPAYWNLLSNVDSLLILCCRILFSLVLMFLLLVCTKRTHVFWETLKNKKQMRLLMPAAVLITANWGLYIWAVNAGHVLDSSLGYYMNPLVVFALGVLFFKERCGKLQLVGVALAVIGVLISVIAYGSFPFISVGLAFSFGAYGLVKKLAHSDPVAGICVETLLVTPFAIAFALIFRSGDVAALRFTDVLLLIGSGAATAVPLVLYSRSVNTIPFIIVGFLQYISPTLGLIYGLLIGEPLTPDRIVSFVFIGLGLVAFSIATAKGLHSEEKPKSV